MDSSASSVQPVDAHFAPVWRVDVANSQPAEKQRAPSLVAQAAEARAEEQQAQTINNLLPGQMLVEIDRASGRFVHTLTDPQTNEVLLRYPSEGQLAFSRAVSAYIRAASNR